jgi:predicted metalloendopeptidase
LLQLINDHKKEYLEYRGSSFDQEGNLIWAKDDALAYSEGLDKIILLIKNRIPEPVKRKG